MSQINVVLTNSQLAELRQRGLLKDSEVAFLAGDLVIAENPVTSERRIVGEAKLLAENANKRVLKG
tara:strand:+ start:7161 stop:7358 length:198 start_codon:yes stop_codon:yes gene_type:complete